MKASLYKRLYFFIPFLSLAIGKNFLETETKIQTDGAMKIIQKFPPPIAPTHHEDRLKIIGLGKNPSEEFIYALLFGFWLDFRRIWFNFNFSISHQKAALGIGMNVNL